MTDERPIAIVVDLETERKKHDEGDGFRIKHDNFCTHLRKTAHTSQRTVICDKCGASLDPFDTLIQITREWDLHVMREQKALERLLETERRLREVERLERNARARLGRLEKKATGDW